jgi:acyl-CoA synthetase (AMP-forming)/AMP-acid ligase II
MSTAGDPIPIVSAAPVVTVRRISWAAVFAGVTITLVVQLVLSILGLGVGASTIDPLQVGNPIRELGMGAGLWVVGSALLAWFSGGYVAGRLAGVPRRQDSLLHGLLTWSLGTLLMVYLLTTTMGSLIGGTAMLLGRVLVALSSVEAVLQQAGVDTRALTQAVTTTQALTETVSETVDDPQSREELAALINRIVTSGQETISPAHQEALIRFLVERGGRSRPEAEALMASYEAVYQQARAQSEQALAEAEQTARELGAAAARTLATAALWTFVGLVAGAAAAALGGYVAMPREGIRTESAG